MANDDKNKNPPSFPGYAQDGLDGAEKMRLKPKPEPKKDSKK